MIWATTARRGVPACLLLLTSVAAGAEEGGANLDADMNTFARIVCQHGGRYGGSDPAPGLMEALIRARLHGGEQGTYKNRLLMQDKAHMEGNVMVLNKECP